ncbi:MAG: hypothetical protein A2V81_03315 [Candidatus Abawacabacteria bacterium RBG_16_42_10]|uniref:Thioredoxin-like fold domain-containing protein n=1 Tax=Candidatus Abawacabacteria bacterium RBG_16_42_10 TaxID=1817814 RepID=A0A1F4XL83_9BACT|nr:MAG: hypothetical protein A2V81_03315 [Candidatus Abawacabacteria bacterium RBG_16_42_10]
MLCIAAFIVFGFLSIFSVSYRKLAKKAWYCVWRKMTFRPCDINFSQELKGKLLGKLIFTHPRLSKFLAHFANVIAFIFVILTIWSAIYVSWAGLNLYVYDTCEPTASESCSLAGEFCGVGSLGDEEFSLWNTILRIPDRWKDWKGEDYISQTATYYKPFDANKKTAVELIDPSCKFCKKLWGNIEEAKFFDTYNLSYVVYPIPAGKNNFRFPNSYMMASYLEATKKLPLSNTGTTVADWQLLEKFFGDGDATGTIQEQFNNIKDNPEQARTRIHEFLKDIGYNDEQIKQLQEISDSQEVKDSLAQQKAIVEEKVRTIKIPTIIFGGRRFDRVIDANALR